MKIKTITFPEILNLFAFLLYLLGSSIALIHQGIEISLWLMSFAIVISAATTVFPLLGIQWLKINKMGWQAGRWMAILLQAASWGTFGYAMIYRFSRIMGRFHTLIAITTLLWALWLLAFIYSRHACHPPQSDDKLEETKPHSNLGKEM